MIKLVALFTHPPDREAFERHYAGTHMPLVRKMPGLKRVEIARVTGAPRGESPYFLVCEMYWENAEAMNASLASPEGRAVGRDSRDFASDLLTMHIAEVEDNGSPA